MITIVTGCPRTGTSMMMGSLIKGGIPALYDPERYENWQKVFNDRGEGGYEFNPSGIYELKAEVWHDKWFPREHEGRCVKVHWWMVQQLAPMDAGYHFIQMRRHPEEIRQSAEAMLPGTKAEWWLSVPGEYERRMDLSLEYIRNRRDTLSATVVDYPLEEPECTFLDLARVGVPIEPYDAVLVYDEKHYRFRLELLEAGI